MPRTPASIKQRAELLNKSLSQSFVGVTTNGTPHLDDTHFAWIGKTTTGRPFYYRIQSPVILIEFDHQGSLRMPAGVPNRDHIHTVVRTPKGNDYGKDLLRQHYLSHPHPQ